MLRAYRPIEHGIFRAHELIEYLVNELWCQADQQSVEDKLDGELKVLYEQQDWFRKNVDTIYSVCQNISEREKADFQIAFKTNNRIKDLCARDIAPISLDTLNENLVIAVKPFFKELYTRFLDWKAIRDSCGDKKAYYDELNLANCFNECPCCGFGDLKTIYSKGRSAYDHYLPQKHYPFSSTNFQNLVPICTTCNSDAKGEKNILSEEKPLFYPFASNHPDIMVKVDVDSKILPKLMKETGTLKDKIKPNEIKINFSINDDRIESWDSIFNIRDRYFERVAVNRVGWLKKVAKRFNKYKDKIQNYSIDDAFDDIINDDSDDQLGFLKSPYLSSLKTIKPLVKAIEEVSSHSKFVV